MHAEGDRGEGGGALGHDSFYTNSKQLNVFA